MMDEDCPVDERSELFTKDASLASRFRKILSIRLTWTHAQSWGRAFRDRAGVASF